MLNFHAWSIPYESMHHSYLKKTRRFSIHFEMLQLTSFSPSKTQHSLGISKRKKPNKHIGDAKGVYKNKLAYQTDVAKRQLLKGMYKTFMLLPDCFLFPGLPTLNTDEM